MNGNKIIIKNHNNFAQKKGYKVLAFLLGLFVANNIVYIFKFGEVVPNVSILYSIIIMCYFMVFKINKFKNALKMFNKMLYAYILLIFFSLINVLIVFSNNSYMLSRYFNGLIYLFMNLAPYVLTLILYKEKKYIIKGLGFGFCFNLLISALSYLYFNSGNVFTLYDIFPQNAFFVPTYTFRTQGLFLEPSYYMAFIISTFLILLVSNKSGIFKKLVVVLTCFVVVISLSKNTTILVFIFLLFKLLKIGFNRNKKIRIKYTVLLTTVFFNLIGLIFVILYWDVIQNLDLLNKLMISWDNLLALDSLKSIRIFNMQQALDIIPRYIFGVGYNMSHSIMEIVYSSNLSVNATFNFLITNQLELGLLGTIIYIILIKQLSWDLVFKGKSTYSLAVGLSVLGAFLCQIGNGIRFYPFILVVFGLATIEHFNIKNEITKKTNLQKQSNAIYNNKYYLK